MLNKWYGDGRKKAHLEGGGGGYLAQFA